jgi:hypothetical protein
MCTVAKSKQFGLDPEMQLTASEAVSLPTGHCVDELPAPFAVVGSI